MAQVVCIMGAPATMGVGKVSRLDDPSAVGTDTTVDTTGVATTVDLNGDGYPDVVTGTEVCLSPRLTLTSLTLFKP